jgi:hypothetical protein
MNRLALRVTLAVAILVLCFYSDYEYSQRHSSIPQIKDDPDRYENVSFRDEGAATNVRGTDEETRFTLMVRGDTIDAVYPRKSAVKEGDHVIVLGTLHMKSGYLLVSRLHVYRDIRRLYALSFVGLGLLLALFFRDWRLVANWSVLVRKRA